MPQGFAQLLSGIADFLNKKVVEPIASLPQQVAAIPQAIRMAIPAPQPIQPSFSTFKPTYQQASQVKPYIPPSPTIIPTPKVNSLPYKALSALIPVQQMLEKVPVTTGQPFDISPHAPPIFSWTGPSQIASRLSEGPFGRAIRFQEKIPDILKITPDQLGPGMGTPPQVGIPIIGAVIGSRVVNKLLRNPELEPAVKFLANKLTNEDVNILGKFVAQVEKNPTANLGQMGKTVQAFAEQTFGKNAATWSNKKIASAINYTLQRIGQGENSAGLGLSTVDVSKGLAKPGSKPLFKIKPEANSEKSTQFITQPEEKVRKFILTTKKSIRTVPEVAQEVKSTYTPIINKATIAEADRIINTNFDEAINIAKNGPSTAVNNAVSQRLIEKFQNEKNYNQAIDLVESLAAKPTSQGQAIQILSYWGKLNPIGALRAAQRLIDRANTGKTSGFVKLSEALTKRITDLAGEVQKLPEGRDKLIKTAELVDTIHSAVPPSLLRKISTIQTLAQLLNPKTAIRNIVGNLGFMGGENISQTIATPLDKAISVITGKRTTTLPSIITQAKGFGLGLKQGVEEALKGVDTMGMGKQFDLPTGQVFQNKVLGGLEKALGVELKATDRAFYKAAFDDSLRGQMQLAKVTEPTPEMLETAHAVGLYRTFQDSSWATKLFTGIKKALNFNKEFGLGDIVLKYPKTPASLLVKGGIDYSPIGFINTLFKMAGPLIGRPFDQKAFVDSFSRALVGTGGLLTTGAILHRLGIITGKPEKDKDISAVQRASGLGQYQINASALKRFVLSGFNTDATKPQEGDMLISYDWFQPQAIGLSMGANIDENGGKAIGQVPSLLTTSIQGGTETLANQPLVQGLARLFQGYSLPESVANAIQGAPASFVPTLLSQVNQLIDNTSRNTYSPDYYTESMNLVKNKVPGLAQTLPVKYDVWGQPQERYQGGTNNWFNVFFNPAFVSIIKTNPGAKEVLDMFERSGETQQAPRIAPKTIKVNGKNIDLTGEQQALYQQYIGQNTQIIFDKLVQSSSFKTATDEQKAKVMASILSTINNQAKLYLFNVYKGKLIPIEASTTQISGAGGTQGSVGPVGVSAGVSAPAGPSTKTIIRGRKVSMSRIRIRATAPKARKLTIKKMIKPAKQSRLAFKIRARGLQKPRKTTFKITSGRANIHLGGFA